MLLVIPAIDLRGGHCVRLRQGHYEDETVYFDDPVKMAKLWRVQNARTLHLVDLDAARTAQGHGPAGSNREIIREIAGALDIPVEVGGGVRTLDDIEEILEMGVYRAVLGTAAVHDPDMVEEAVRRFSCSRVIVAIDARDGQVRVEGWEADSGIDSVELALDMERRGVRRIIYTDIARDGMLSGPNMAAYRTLAEALTKCRITAAGGVSGYRDLLRLQELATVGLDSVIIGRALYENRFPCQQFWCWHRKDLVDLDIYSTARLATSLPPGDCL
jgi:phosphoribosylformimino-5-aminoimidazole carboxamide ribotide isomerase